MISVRLLSDPELQDLLRKANVTETDIMEYADGVLAPRRRLAVRTALANYPDLMQLLESYLFTRGPVASAFTELYSQSSSEQLLSRLEQAEQPPARPRRKLFSFSRSNLPPFKLKFRAPVIAAFAALAAVVLTAWFMNQRINEMKLVNQQVSQRINEINQVNQQLSQRMTQMVRDFVPPDKQGVAAPPLLQQALESTPMGQSARLADHIAVKPQLTFFSRLEIWCREFGLVYGDNALWLGQLACRDKDGVWRVRIETNPRLLLGKEYPAGEEGEGVLARARDDLKHRDVGDMLGPEKEKPLLENHWQGKP